MAAPDKSKLGATRRVLLRLNLPRQLSLRSGGVSLANRSAVNTTDVLLLQELARQLPECDRAAKLRALLTRVVEVQHDASAFRDAAEALAVSAAEALADDPWSAFEVAARQLRSRMHPLAATNPT